MDSDHSQDIPPKRRRSRTRRAIRLVLGLLVFLCLAVVIGVWVVTRSWFIISQITPEMERKLGGEVTIGQAAYQGDGRIIFTDLKLHARGLEGDAAEIASIGTAIVSIDLRRLLAGSIRVSEVEVDRAVFRVSEDVHESGYLNLWALHPEKPSASRRPLPPPPKIRVRNATWEFGWHDGEQYQPVGQRTISGEMYPTPGAPRLYTFVMSEVDETGTGLVGGILMKGEWNASTNEWHTRIDGIELDDRIYRMCPQMARAWWERLNPKGSVNGVEMHWHPQQSFSMQLSIRDVALTLPVDATDTWARYRGGVIDESPSRPRMHFSSGKIHLTRDSLVFEDLTGMLASAHQQQDVVGVPYQVNFSITSLPPLDWEQRGDWMEQILQTAPFDLRFRMDQFSLQPEPDGQPAAVDLPLLVAKVLAKFNVSNWVLSTSVHIHRDPPQVDEHGTLRPSRAITTGHAYLQQASGRYQKFPYQLDDVNAYLQFDNQRVVVHYLTGKGSGNSQFRITGEIAPPENDAAVRLQIVGTNVPIDERLRNALRENELKAFEALFNRPAHEALSNAQLLPDAQAIERDRQRLGDLQRELDQRRLAAESEPESRNLNQLQAEIAALQRHIDAGPFELGGAIDLDLQVQREQGPKRKTVTTGRIDVRSVGLLYERFPYPIRVVDGSLDWQADRVVIMPGPSGKGLTLVTPGGGIGTANGNFVFPRGSGQKLQPNLNIAIQNDLLNDSLLAAIPLTTDEQHQLGDALYWPGNVLSKPARLIRGLGLRGSGDYEGVIRPDESGRIGYDFDVTLDGGQAMPGNELARELRLAGPVWPHNLTLQDVQGTIHITRDAVSIDNVTGTNGRMRATLGGEIALRGPQQGTRLHLDIDSMPVGEHLLNLQNPGPSETALTLWDQYRPTGEFDALLVYHSREDAADSIDATIQPHEVNLLLHTSGDQAESQIVRYAGGVLLYEDRTLRATDLALNLFNADDEFQGHATIAGVLQFQSGVPVQLAGRIESGRFESPLVSHLVERFAEGAIANAHRDSRCAGLFDAAFEIDRSASDVVNWDVKIAPLSLTMDWNGRTIHAIVDGGGVQLNGDAILLERLTGLSSSDDRFGLDGMIRLGELDQVYLTVNYEGDLRSDLFTAFLPKEALTAIEHIKFTDAGPTRLVNCTLERTQYRRQDNSIGWRTAFHGPLHTHAASFAAGMHFSDVNGAFDFNMSHYSGEEFNLSIEVNVERARAMGQRLRNACAHISVAENGSVLLMPDFRAEADDGVVAAHVVCGLGDRRDYQVSLSMADVPLDGFSIEGIGQPASRQSSGEPAATGELYATMTMSGSRGDPSSRRGRSTLRVLRGRLVSMPLVVQLMQVMQLSAPLGGNLDFADASLYLQGDRIIFERLLFESTLGNASMLQLSGEGEMDFDTLEMKTRFRSRGAVPIVRDIVGEVGDMLYAIEVTGTLGDPHARVVPLPR